MLYEVITHKSDVGLTFESLAKKKEILMDFYRNIKAENVLTTILGGETFDDRITSYNVCYTKLLRIHSFLKAFRNPPS